MDKFIVICRADTLEDGSPGPYVLGTRTVFDDEEQARGYAQGIAPGREPLVVSGDFRGLRFETERATQFGVTPSPTWPSSGGC